MPKSIFVYLVALFFLIGSVLFLSSFFLNSSSSELIKQNNEIIFEAKNISINLGFKESDFILEVNSSMVNSLKDEKNLYVYQPTIDISGKNTFLKIISNKGTIAYDKNIVKLENRLISSKIADFDILKLSQPLHQQTTRVEDIFKQSLLFKTFAKSFDF